MLPFRIAHRYFFAKRKQGFIHLISWVSMFGVGIGTMALVVVLSVFNGLEEFNREIFKLFTADLKITPKQGKYFELNTKQINQIRNLEGVSVLSEVIEDNALVRYRNAQSVCSIKGIEEQYLHESGLTEKVFEGKGTFFQDSIPKSIIGANVQGTLSLILDDYFNPLELWYPEKKISLSINPENNLRSLSIGVAGVFYVEQQFDNTILLPIKLAEKLTGNLNKRTAIEIKCKTENDINALKTIIKKLVGNQFIVATNDEQNAALLKAIHIEKLFIFVALIFIIGIAAFNIFFSLTMLVLDKKGDIKTLSAMGANGQLIKQIFFVEGVLIAFIGVFAGLALGLTLCYLQQTYGFIKLGLSTSLIEAYPVKIQTKDITAVVLTVLCISSVIAYFPARKAGKMVFD